MKISLWPSYERSWEETLELARFAEDRGYHSFCYPDHLMPQHADDAPDPGPALDCWTVLAAVAAQTTRVRLVSVVSPTTIHHPVVLAKRATTVDHVSGGRVTLGLGAGWQANEHTAYGFELPSAGPRVDRFAEAIEVIHRLLRGDVVDHRGEYYRLTGAPFAPTPVQRPLPLLVGTGGDRMMRLTARFADQWNIWGTPESLPDPLERLRVACEREGRDPATMWRTVAAMAFIARDDRHRESLAPLAASGRAIVGSAEQLLDTLGRYRELGIDEYCLPDFALGPTPQARREALESLHEQVVRHVLP